MKLTYAGFLAVFLLPPLVIAIAAMRGRFRARHGWLLLALSIVVVVWTTPWDNAAAAMGLWGFDPERVSGFWLGWLPIEEYAFFLLQTWVASLAAMRLLMR